MLDNQKNRRGLSWVLVAILFILTLLVSTSDQVPAAGNDETLPAGRSLGGDVYTFLPLMANHQATLDLSLAGLETTQATQTAGMNVPLITNRPALLRIYAETSEDAATPGVDLAIFATRNGVPLAGSPLLLADENAVPDARRDDLDRSINVLLPAGWLNGDVDLHVILDPENTISEWDEGNNEAFLTMQFNPVPPMNITIVPIRYTHIPLGQTYPPPSVDTISEFIRRTYPISTINITFRAAYNFVGNLDELNEWVRLLDEITAARIADAPPADVFYYGLVPVLNGNGAWFNGGIAGFAWIGNPRVGIGLDLTPLWQNEYSSKLAAHEIGHNLGRRHAPCGVGTGLDQNYPYAGGRIGEYGVDVTVPHLFPPTTTYDFMSYCHPQWLSDYTYQGLFTGLTVTVPNEPAGEQDGLLVRAILEDGETATILPAYAFSSRPSPLPDKSDTMLEMLDETSGVIAAYPVQLLQAEEAGVEVKMIAAMLPLPAGERVAALRLLQNGRVLATRTLAAPETATGVTVTGESLHWTADRPVLVRYINNQEQTWLTLAVDAVNELVLPPDLDLNNGDIMIIPSR